MLRNIKKIPNKPQKQRPRERQFPFKRLERLASDVSLYFPRPFFNFERKSLLLWIHAPDHLSSVQNNKLATIYNPAMPGKRSPPSSAIKKPAQAARHKKALDERRQKKSAQRKSPMGSAVTLSSSLASSGSHARRPKSPNRTSPQQKRRKNSPRK